MSRFNVITVGSATIDSFVYTNTKEIKNKERDKKKKIQESRNLICYPVGAKLLVKNIFFDIGGGGTNTAVAFSRLGFKTGYIGCLGDDENASRILQLLKEEKVKFLGTRANMPTGYSVILDSREHNRTVLAFKGANDNLNFHHIRLRKLKTSWLYLSSMTGDSFKSQLEIARFAKEKKIKIAYNPSEYQVSRHKALYPIIQHTELLVLNKEEAQILCKSSSESIIYLLSELHDLGAKIACITDGPNGAFLSVDDIILKVIPHDIKVIERTGAGDAFASSLLAGIIKFCHSSYDEHSLARAMSLALINSESVIKYVGAKNKLLIWNEIQPLIHKSLKNIVRMK